MGDTGLVAVGKLAGPDCILGVVAGYSSLAEGSALALAELRCD